MRLATRLVDLRFDINSVASILGCCCGPWRSFSTKLIHSVWIRPVLCPACTCLFCTCTSLWLCISMEGRHEFCSFNIGLVLQSVAPSRHWSTQPALVLNTQQAPAMLNNVRIKLLCRLAYTKFLYVRFLMAVHVNWAIGGAQDSARSQNSASS